MKSSLRLFALTGLFIVFSVSSCSVIDLSSLGAGPLTEGEARLGINEALLKGINNGVTKASVIDGFLGNPLIKIPIPPEAQGVADALNRIGLDGEIQKAITAMNRAAEDASKEAGPIFRDALRQLTITEAIAIVKGSNDEATRFLRRNTQDKLTAAFSPIIRTHLENTNATRLWADIFTRYNRIPLVRPVNVDLDAYVTHKALEGLFTLVAQEELAIRTNPAERTTAILKRVFGNATNP